MVRYQKRHNQREIDRQLPTIIDEEGGNKSAISVEEDSAVSNLDLVQDKAEHEIRKEGDAENQNESSGDT